MLGKGLAGFVHQPRLPVPTRPGPSRGRRRFGSHLDSQQRRIRAISQSASRFNVAMLGSWTRSRWSRQAHQLSMSPNGHLSGACIGGLRFPSTGKPEPFDARTRQMAVWRHRELVGMA